jgi:putative membrane protein
MKIKSLVFATMLALPLNALADTPIKPPTSTDKSAKLSDDDVKIVAHLHHVNVMQIDLGKQAKVKGTAAVKSLGETLIKDHSTADKELAAMAKKKGIAKIPAAEPATEADKAEIKQHSESIAALKKLKGADFDREYLRMVVEDHEKELAKSDVFIASAQDTDLKTMLETNKTVLQRHHDAAKELQQSKAQASAKP